MTDAMGGGDRGVMRQRIVQKSLEDDAFRRRLLEDPRAAIERELNTRLPAGVEIRTVEETPDTVYLLLPGRPTDAESGELSDRDLESVAGGEGAGDDYSAGWGPARRRWRHPRSVVTFVARELRL